MPLGKTFQGLGAGGPSNTPLGLNSTLDKGFSVGLLALRPGDSLTILFRWLRQ